MKQLTKKQVLAATARDMSRAFAKDCATGSKTATRFFIWLNGQHGGCLPTAARRFDRYCKRTGVARSWQNAAKWYCHATIPHKTAKGVVK